MSAPETSPQEGRVVIVGACAGGVSTAEALRRLGHQGPITLIGDEDHLPYDRPPLSKEVLRGEYSEQRLLLRSRDDLRSLDLRLGSTAVALDTRARTVALSGGERVHYQSLVIATGVRPRGLPSLTVDLGAADPTGSELSGVHVLNTLDDSLALRADLRPGQRLVIVGAGFIGSEVAATARLLDLDVTLLSRSTYPMASLVGAEVGEELERLHRAQGVDVQHGAAVDHLLSEGGKVTGVRLSGGRTVPADVVLIAAGSQPNTEWLQGSGLVLSDGVVCDEFCSAADSVYAVGDVARWRDLSSGRLLRVPHRTNASEQAVAVARNILDPVDRRPYTPVPYFWSDQFNLRLQAYGHLGDHDEAVVVEGSLSAHRALVAYRRQRELSGVLAIGMPPTALRPWRRHLQQRTPWAAALEATPAA